MARLQGGLPMSDQNGTAIERYPAATLHEAYDRCGALPPMLKPVARGMELGGPAFPVRCPVGENLVLHHAVANARPGEVLVVDVPDGEAYGYWGDILSSAAKARGLGGLIITGGVRDVVRLGEIGFPVFAAQVSIRGTGKDTRAPWSMGDAVAIGGVTIARGDYVRGDEDGIVAIASSDLKHVLEMARRREDHEQSVLDRIAGGETTLEIYEFPELGESDPHEIPARVSVDVPGLSHGALPIPAASRIGDLLATGGLRGVDRETGVLPPDVEGQVANMFANLRAVVEAAGGAPHHILKMTIWTSEPGVREIVNREWVCMFPDAGSRPARHMLNYALPGGMLVQCEALAVIARRLRAPRLR